MGNLFGALELGRNALQVNQLCIQVTGHNLANVNTEGYTKQEVQLEDIYYQQSLYGEIGLGVNDAGIDAYRNKYVLRRILDEMQVYGYQEMRMEGLDQLESITSPEYENLSEEMADFFASFQALSADPTNIALRQDVLATANQMADEFHNAYEQVQDLQVGLNEMVGSQVEEINQLTERIAALNQEVFQTSAVPNGNSSDPIDLRNKAVKDLAELIGINVVEDTNGVLHIQTESGGVLVSGNEHTDLVATPDAVTGWDDVVLEGTDITASIKGGKLGGLIALRDVDIPEILNDLDVMAATMISQVNTVHSAGWDLNNVNGTNFFQPFVTPGPGPYTGAARAITVAITDPESVAASSAPNEPGNNVNALALVALEDASFATLGGKTFNQYWDISSTDLAVKAQEASGDLEATTATLTALENQRDSESGVSLDEEGANLIRFQNSYEAMARYITVIDELLQQLLQLAR